MTHIPLHEGEGARKADENEGTKVGGVIRFKEKRSNRFSSIFHKIFFVFQDDSGTIHVAVSNKG
jgi:hypothetical protein